MNTAKARRLFNAYAQIHAKLKIMEHETDLKNTAHEEARRKLTEALGRLEIAVGGLPGPTKQSKRINLISSVPRGAREGGS